MKGQATVVKNAGSHFLLSRLPEWQPFPAVLKGKVRLKGSEATNPVAVGDKVTYEYSEEPSATHPASIVEVLDRRNYVIRRSTNLSRQSHVIAANLDRAFIVVTLFFPEIKLPFLDRLLVTCEVYGIPATIVLNKVDIFRKEFPEQLADFHRIYESAGYPVIETSALTGEGINELKAAIGSPEDGHIGLFSGESGVGKSSIIKALDPSLNGRVKKQVQHYNKYLKNSSFGVEKFNFSLGLLLIFNCTEWTYSSVSPLKSVPFGMYCRMSLFVFSIAPFCQDE